MFFYKREKTCFLCFLFENQCFYHLWMLRMLRTESLTVRIRIELGGNGHKPPDSFSFRSSFRSRFRSSSSSTTSGDIFYCSGSRQLNHSSYTFV